MESKLFNPFYIELKKVFEILETSRMAIEKLDLIQKRKLWTYTKTYIHI